MTGQAVSKDLVLAVLQVAQDELRSPLAKTELTKFIYLLDVLSARAHQGRTATGFEWKFIKFGPYAFAIDDVLNELTKSGRINSEDKDRQGGGEYVLFSLRGEHRGLEALGIDKKIVSELRTLVKQLHGNLNRLLGYVYNETEPMSFARPGETLSFQDCVTVPYASIKPVSMPKLAPEVIDRARKMLASASENSKSDAAEWVPGPIDEAFVAVLSDLERDASSRIEPQQGTSNLRW